MNNVDLDDTYDKHKKTLRTVQILSGNYCNSGTKPINTAVSML